MVYGLGLARLVVLAATLAAPAAPAVARGPAAGAVADARARELTAMDAAVDRLTGAAREQRWSMAAREARRLRALAQQVAPALDGAARAALTGEADRVRDEVTRRRPVEALAAANHLAQLAMVAGDRLRVGRPVPALRLK